jgi:hypothetical protein
MDAATVIGLVAAGYVGTKVIKKTLGGHAPIPAGQTATGLAPSIRGHVIPVPPSPAYVAATQGLFPGDPTPGLLAQLNVPRVRSDGIWIDAAGAPYQFHDCSGQPDGRAGYMSLRYKQWLDANVYCDGTPILDYAKLSSSGASGGLDPAAQTAVQVGTTAAVAIGSAAAGSSGAGAAVAAGAAAALACLGPTPGFLGGEGQWTTVETHTLRVRHGTRTLGLTIALAGGWWIGSAIETVALEAETPAAEAMGRMYDDHAHAVLGMSQDRETMIVRAEMYAAAWLEGLRRDEPCGCAEIEKVA